MRRLALAATAMAAVVSALPATALGSGGPPISTSVRGVSTGKSVIDTSSGDGRTIVARILRRSNRLVAARSIPLAGFGVPAIGLYEPTPAGLSADGRALVLQQPNIYGPNGARTPESRFAILNAKSLRLDRVVELHGAFGFDGLSPDGRRMYLVEYPSPLRNPTHYVVRAYDLPTGRLDPKPIVDPADDEQMRGLPVTRTMGPHGRWAYTLYTGGDGGAFIHALDLGRGRAKCIDLPSSIGNVYRDRLRMTRGGSTVTLVGKRGQPVASIDTRTFDVSTPAVAGAEPISGSGSSFPWLLLALGAGLLFAAGSLWAMPRLHRRRLAGTEE